MTVIGWINFFKESNKQNIAHVKDKTSHKRYDHCPNTKVMISYISRIDKMDNEDK
ncbi:MAG: hypothetical protein OXB84_08505 [Halobacteriovoraceae bacterium]|nr:hypothetical protein [Halobacteriovoraceae bacterium]